MAHQAMLYSGVYKHNVLKSAQICSEVEGFMRNVAETRSLV